MPDRPARRTWMGGCMQRIVPALLAFSLIAPTLAGGSELRQSPIVKAVQQARPSVVSIRGEKTIAATAAQAGRGKPRRVNGMGTGVVIDPRGYILTNYHVVDGVPRDPGHHWPTTKHYTATLVARDMETDLAIIKIDAEKKCPAIHARHFFRSDARRDGDRGGQRLRIRAHGHARASSARCTARCRSATRSFTTT